MSRTLGPSSSLSPSFGQSLIALCPIYTEVPKPAHSNSLLLRDEYLHEILPFKSFFFQKLNLLLQ